MKKILLLIIAVMLTLTINAETNINQSFDGSVTVATQYLDGYHNVRLQWEDNTSSDEYFAYIITLGNSDNEENYIVKGFTTDSSFSLYNRPNQPNLSTYYNVYKVNFNQNVELADYISDGSGENEIRVALTWSQIKELLKRKSNNIWKIRRNNIPTNLH